MMLSLRRCRSSAGALVASTALVLCPSVAASASSPATTWAEQAWTQAKQAEDADALQVLSGIEEIATEPGMEALGESLGRYQQNLAKREQARADRIEEVKGELAEHAEAGDLTQALRAAIELHTLSRDKQGVLDSQAVRDLVAKADEKAHEDERAGRWLEAHSLFTRLSLLFEADRRYEKDLKRLSQRLLMLRMYTPELLHDMRSEQRVAEGEDALPPYNPIGLHWERKLSGVDKNVVLRAIWQAHKRHLDNKTTSLAKLLNGGIESVRTLVTTSDLRKAFPGLASKEKRFRFLETLDMLERQMLARDDKAGQRELFYVIREIMDANERTVGIADEALLHEFGNGAVGQLDEFSAIIWPDEMERFRRTTDGTFKGVGIQITLNEALELEVVTPLAGTPASRAGIRPGDIIRKIDGDSTLGIALGQAVDRITGEEGTGVVLGVEREGVDTLIDFDLIRAEIPIHSVKGWVRTGSGETDWDYMIDREHGIGYVRLTQFTRDTSKELASAVDQMRREGLNGLVLDLRYNPGGLLTEAVNVSSMFYDRGTVVTQVDADGQIVETQRARRGRAVLSDMPVVCLVNGGSASASEIVAGSLQDQGKAVIVGERSFGKGSVQNVFSLSPDAAFKLTTQYYRLPSTRVIHRKPGSNTWGIEPDIEVEMLPAQVGDALTIRQKADIIEFDAQGRIDPDAEHVDPTPLLTEGIDPQLETAVLLLQSRVIPEQAATAAASREKVGTGAG